MMGFRVFVSQLFVSHHEKMLKREILNPFNKFHGEKRIKRNDNGTLKRFAIRRAGSS